MSSREPSSHSTNCQSVNVWARIESTASGSVEDSLEGTVITGVIDEFLGSLSKQKRIIFVRRYWYAQSIREIARAFDMSEGQIKSILFRLRGSLREALEKEGVHV